MRIRVDSFLGEAQKEVDFMRMDAGPLLWLSRTYCQIWKEPPWNEHFWEERKVLNMIEEEMALPCFEGFLAAYQRELYSSEHECPSVTAPSEEERSRVIGFSWGFYAPEGKLEEISQSESLLRLLRGYGRTFYVSDLGVVKAHRRKGIGIKLLGLVIDGAKRHDVQVIALRTHKLSVARSLYTKLGFQDSGIEDGRHPERTYFVMPLR